MLRVLRTRRGLVAAVAVLLLAGGGAAAYLLAREPGDVSNPEVEFTAPPPAPPPKPRPKPPPDRFRWPYYGFDAAHTKVLPASNAVRPPYRRGWVYEQNLREPKPLEFPPSIDSGSVYLLRDDGILVAIRSRGGRVRWRKRLGRLAAASPAVGDGRVCVVLLAYQGLTQGRVACLRQKDGSIIWSRKLPARAESSPVLLGGRIFFGSEDGRVYAHRVRDGRRLWTYTASGAVKASPAVHRGVLYFGDYGGEVHAVRARDGSRVWTAGTSGGAFGRAGRFYSTAAVAFGRVYVGNIDGRMYSFAASSGQLAWATRTGGYVYSSPAVASPRRLGPTVYAGSYDGNFYAWDARTGAVRWTYPAGGRISGGAFVVGGLVWFSDLGNRDTIALGLATGRRRFRFGDGAFNPVVSDRRNLYLVGYANLYQLIPKRRPRSARPAA